jgi:hypothetical protein
VKPAALALLASLCAGCGATYVQHHLLGPAGPAHRRPVRTILDGERVPPARAVALVQAIGRGANADLPHLIDGLRTEAQRLGCDAVVQVRIARAMSTATAVGIAVRWVAQPDGVPRPTAPAADAPWAPPPPLPDAPSPSPSPDATAAPPPWSAP